MARRSADVASPRPLKYALAALLTFALAGCSKATDVSARFIDGKIGFIALGGEVDCIYTIEMREHESNRVVWSIPYDAQNRKCAGGLPILYGASLPGMAPDVAPMPLKPGTVYDLSGMGSGSNSFSVSFVLTIEGHLLRLKDLSR